MTLGCTLVQKFRIAQRQLFKLKTISLTIYTSQVIKQLIVGGTTVGTHIQPHTNNFISLWLLIQAGQLSVTGKHGELNTWGTCLPSYSLEKLYDHAWP